MKLFALGLRGIPGVQGGIETHAEQLYPRLVARGVRVTVLGRSPYVRSGAHAGVEIVSLPSPRRSGIEAFVHTLVGVLYAALHRPDVLHIHAIGPGLFVPLARVLGLRVVFTHHGEDYRREKWGRLARALLRAGERLAVRFANETIVISEPIRQALAATGARRLHRISNGLPALGAGRASACQLPSDLALEPGRYILSVARLVPEKRQLDLIGAFRAAQLAAPELQGWKLVLVGSGVDGDAYATRVAAAATETAGVVLAGFRSGDPLAALFTHCGLFVLPSSHEGHPIALLEAVAYGARVLASDIPANLAVGLPNENYVPVGDVHAWARALARVANDPDSFRLRDAAPLMRRFDWEDIADRTQGVLSAATVRPPRLQRSRKTEG